MPYYRVPDLFKRPKHTASAVSPKKMLVRPPNAIPSPFIHPEPKPEPGPTGNYLYVLDSVFIPISLRLFYGIDTDTNGNIYLTTATDAEGYGSIQKYDKDGTFLREISSGNLDMNPLVGTSPPVHIAVDAENGYYYCTYPHSGSAAYYVVKFSEAGDDGQCVTSWGGYGSSNGNFNYPHGIAYYDEEIFVVDVLNHRVEVFDPDGTYLRKFGSYGMNDGEFFYPGDIWIDNDGIRYVVEFYDAYPWAWPANPGNGCRVQLFDTNDTFISSFGGHGIDDGYFFQPIAITKVPNADYFVLNFYRSGTNHRYLHHLSHDKEFLTKYRYDNDPYYNYAYDCVIDRYTDGTTLYVLTEAGVVKFIKTENPIT